MTVGSGHVVSRRGNPRAPGWVHAYRIKAVAADLCGAGIGSAVAFEVRFGGFTPYVVPYVLVSLALPIVWTLAVALHRAYEPRMIGVGSEEFRRVLQSGLALTAGTAIGSYATKTDIARGYVVLALPLVTLLSLVFRYALRRGLHRRRAGGGCMRKVVAVGHAASVAELVALFRAEPHHGLHVVAACLPERVPGDVVADVPVAGDLSDVPIAVDQFDADTVAVLACPEMDGQALRRLAWRLESTRTELVVAPALMDVAGPRTTIRPAAGLPLLHVEHPELTGVRQLLKNVFDRLVAVVLLVLLAPLLAGLAIAVRATSPGPALFRQTRVGRGGRLFTILKFRTMRRGSDQQKVTLVSDRGGLLFKMRNDPRVTPLGVRMRRHSLDELPQLINIVLGHMSLVGPRPPLPEEVARYGDDVRRRLLVRPGLTGLWQVSGRSDLSWEESVRLDLRYVENWSLTLDLQILWKTWSAVARGQGAY
ncbi:UDP-glucose:undecaprenyl-phosphate glucose-1-phosphate transferase [Nonomuraea coxensis DSM 45129]|uniref:UDP-glucose:undecaprenyl-phosphate glucose-1-phosphate transferase n=1 Tax=Nonomuraea coxensis DSM 45129 TaxID=1122611 RepID=A0ABX8UDP8_9ACTN|nr:sugar transferase [Nonomuraea coxensis]QYC45061.1 UDP-glucose:undecaprenyl-phosphate glucose-1-phosphate transferase [Nonomuraea coxensis DSM 45129]